MKITFFSQFKKRHNSEKAMTLIETLVYMSLLIILLAAIINSILVLTTHYRAVRSTREIEDTGIAILDRMTRDIRSADDVLTDSSVFNVSPGTLSIISRDVTSGLSTTTVFYVSNGRFVVSENGVFLGPLSKAGVQIVGFTVRLVDTANADAIKIELSMQSDQAAPYIVSKNFYSTVVMRGTYK